eukprot:6944301-Pyramimonas_sp.AAC.1
MAGNDRRWHAFLAASDVSQAKLWSMLLPVVTVDIGDARFLTLSFPRGTCPILCSWAIPLPPPASTTSDVKGLRMHVHSVTSSSSTDLYLILLKGPIVYKFYASELLVLGWAGTHKPSGNDNTEYYLKYQGINARVPILVH